MLTLKHQESNSNDKKKIKEKKNLVLQCNFLKISLFLKNEVVEALGEAVVKI